MTAHKYYKRGLVTAEQFDGTNVMADKYGLGPSLKHPESSMWWAINTLARHAVSKIAQKNSAPLRHAFPQNFSETHYSIRGGACDGAFIN